MSLTPSGVNGGSCGGNEQPNATGSYIPFGENTDLQTGGVGRVTLGYNPIPGLFPLKPEAKQAPDFADEDLDALAAQLESFDWKEDVTEIAKKLLNSETLADNLKGVLRFKQMLCIAREKVFKIAADVIKAGVLPRLVQMMMERTDYDLLLATAFCLTNVAAGDDDQTDSVVRAGSIPVLMSLLEHPSPQLRRQAIFCLANIAGSTPENRRLLMEEKDYCMRVIHSAEACANGKIESLAAWNIRNLSVLPNSCLCHFAVRYFVDQLTDADGRACMSTGWKSEARDIERYGCEVLSTFCKSAVDGHANGMPIMEFAPRIVGTMMRSFDPIKRDSKILYLDVVFEICRALTPESRSVFFTTDSDLVLKTLLRSRNHSFAVRVKACEILTLLALDPVDSLAARLLTLASDDSCSTCDIALDVVFRKQGTEDPMLVQACAILACRIVKCVPHDFLLGYSRVEELLTLALEVLDHESTQEDRLGGNLHSSGSITEMFPQSASHYSEVPSSQEATVARIARGLECPSNNMFDALCTLEKVCCVGTTVQITRGLPTNPVVTALEGLGASARLNDLLRVTQSLLVSEKIVRLMSENFSIFGMPQ